MLIFNAHFQSQISVPNSWKSSKKSSKKVRKKVTRAAGNKVDIRAARALRARGLYLLWPLLVH
jgi:hypothetical protein